MPVWPSHVSHSAMFSSSMFQARLVRLLTAVRRIPCVRLSAGNVVTTGVRRIAAVIEIFWLDVTEPKWIVPTAVLRTSLEASRPPPPTSYWRITTLGRYLRSDSSIASPIWKFWTWAETKLRRLNREPSRELTASMKCKLLLPKGKFLLSIDGKLWTFVYCH